MAVVLILFVTACGGSGGDALSHPSSTVLQAPSSTVLQAPSSTSVTASDSGSIEAGDVTSTTSFLDWVSSLETIPPITGYGDFSGVDLLDVDHYRVNELIYTCAQDHGIPVDIAPEGDGILFTHVPESQSRQASEIVAACTRGLNLPVGTGEYRGLTLEQAERMFAHLLWVRDCLAEAGYSQPEPPSFDVWLENGTWHPYTAVSSAIIASPALARQCPQWPGAIPEQ